MKNPGIILKLPDNRLVIVYNRQPLLVDKGRVIMNLIDEEYNLLKDENGKAKIILKNAEQYNIENENGLNKLIGYID